MRPLRAARAQKENEMIYELKDLGKVEPLFGDWVLPELKDRDGLTIRIFVTDPDAPRSAMLFTGEEEYFAGEPNRELVQSKQSKEVALLAKEEAWEPLFRECYPEAERVTRYAIHRCKDFEREKLQSFADALPKGYEIRRIDSEIYDLIGKLDDEDLQDLTGDFDTKEEFLIKGRGFVVLKDGGIVAGASSAYCYCDGIDVEIDTDKAERRKGLATAVGAKLILSCLDDGLEPRWDAANLISVHLAEKLGYRFDREYAYYWVNETQNLMIKDPDKSKWPAFCGDYEPLCKAFPLKNIRMQNDDLYGTAVNYLGEDFTFKLLPLGENRFGRAGGCVIIDFGENCLTIDGITCRKL